MVEETLDTEIVVAELEPSAELSSFKFVCTHLPFPLEIPTQKVTFSILNGKVTASFPCYCGREHTISIIN